MAKRKRSNGRRSRRSSRKSRSTTKRIKRVERSIKNINKSIETKYLDLVYENDAVNFVLDNSQSVRFFAVKPTAGTGADSRIGRQIKLTSMYIAIKVETTDSAVSNVFDDAYNRVRFLLVRVKEPSTPGTAPAFSDIFQTDVPTGVDMTMAAPINWDSRKEYKIIWDKWVTLSNYASTGQGDSTNHYWNASGSCVKYVIKKKKKLGFTVEFEYGSQDIWKNDLVFMYQSDSVATPAPTFSAFFRIKYRDP